MQIRPLTQADSDAVRQLDSIILGADRSLTWDTYIDRFLAVAELDSLPHPPWGCFVAEEGGALVGFLFAERQSTGYGLPPGARIVAIAVHPDHRRRGVASGLMDALLDLCQKEGVEQVFAALLATDRRDVRFLRSKGFSGAQVRVLVKQTVMQEAESDSGESDKRAYDALVSRASEIFRRTQDRGGEALATALSQAQEATRAAGEFTSEQLDRASRYLRRDLSTLSDDAEGAATQSRRRVAFSRARYGFLALASDVLERAGSGLSRLSDRMERPLLFQTGEVTGPGTLTCLECGAQMQFQDSGRIPPCPKCHKTRFKKSYG
jgi:ribosomal protein S18 acetylase RimI-like enzyme